MLQHVYMYVDPSLTNTSPIAGRDAATGDQVLKALNLLHEIIEFSEPSADFLAGLLAPVRIALFALTSFTDNQRQRDDARSGIAEVKDKQKQTDTSAAYHLARELLQTWLRLAESDVLIAFVAPESKNGIFGLSLFRLGTLAIPKANETEPHLPVLCVHETSLVVKWLP